MLIIFGFLLAVFMCVFTGVLTGGGFALLVDVPSAVIILIPLIFFLAVSKSGRIIGGYIRSSFQKTHVYTKAELAGIRGAAKNTSGFVLGSGAFGFFVSIMACLMYLGDNEMLGPNVAISIITVLYSIILSVFVFFPVAAWAENKMNLREAEDKPVI